jgi:heat-inducible transcriptional repressor
MSQSIPPVSLDDRQQRILEAVVHDYVETAEPVGSAALLERHQLGIRSATLRSEMALLAERGLLVQPHTSSGRVPSNIGYRYYVNQLMRDVTVPMSAIDCIDNRIRGNDHHVEAVLDASCQALADITGLPSLATPPATGVVSIHRVFLSPVTATQTLLVLLYSNGRSENRILTGFSLTAQESWMLADALNEAAAGIALQTLRDNGLPNIPRELITLSTVWNIISTEVRTAAREMCSGSPVVVHRSEAALQHREFRDVERFGHFLMLMQERAALLELLAGPVLMESSVRIGAELGSNDLGGYSMVTATYSVGEAQQGTIGVIGPTRMRYPEVIASVKHVAKTVGKVLQRLTFS